MLLHSAQAPWHLILIPRTETAILQKMKPKLMRAVVVTGSYGFFLLTSWLYF